MDLGNLVIKAGKPNFLNSDQMECTIMHSAHLVIRQNQHCHVSTSYLRLEQLYRLVSYDMASPHIYKVTANMS